MILRLATGLTLTALAASPALASENAVDPHQRYNPWIFGVQPPASDFRAGVGMVSKYIEQGRVLNDDVTAVADVSGRIYGFGLQVTGGVALADDSRGFFDTEALDMPGLNLKLDFLGELEWDKGIPLLTINPYFEIVTAPVQPSELGSKPNTYKTRQRWLGVDAWVAPPFKGWEGLEFGGGLAINTAPDVNAFRGAVGARQMFKIHGFDIFAYQLANFGNSDYREDLVGGDKDHQGITTLAGGLDVRMALPYREWWLNLGADLSWWVSETDRKAVKATQDTTNLTLSIGIEWIPGE